MLSAVVVRPIRASDESAWRAMFTDYAQGAGIDPAAGSDITWSWILDASRVRCLVAVAVGGGAGVGGRPTTDGDGDGGDREGSPWACGEACGFVHYREFERPITGSRGLWIDDLYVARESRGRGIARHLIEEMRRLAGAGGYDVVRWTTRETNPARRLYDRVAQAAPVVVYNAAPLNGP